MPRRDIEDTQEKVSLAVMANEITNIKGNVQEIKGSLKETLNSMDNNFKLALQEIKTNYVHKSDFEPIKRIVYGVVGLMLTAVFGALISLVVRSQ